MTALSPLDTPGAVTAWVVAVRAAMPSPRPQAWQAFQQAEALASVVREPVVLVADAGRPDGGPTDLADWLGRPVSRNLSVCRPQSPSRPPLAGLRFRRNLAKHRSRDAILLARDPRVVAAEARRPWKGVLMEWHVRPRPDSRVHRRVLAGPALHLTPSDGIAAELRKAGVDPSRIVLIPNACGLERESARRRAASGKPAQLPVLAIGLHRRSGMDLALDAWRSDSTLPQLVIAGTDQGNVRWAAWHRAIQEDSRLAGRVQLVGPRWGRCREEVLGRAAVWLALYPEDETTRELLCPLQVVDAVGSGLTLVTTDLPSTRFAVGDGVAIFVAPGDVGALVDGLHRALGSSRPPEELVVRRPRWDDRARSLVRVASEHLELQVA